MQSTKKYVRCFQIPRMPSWEGLSRVQHYANVRQVKKAYCPRRRKSCQAITRLHFFPLACPLQLLRLPIATSKWRRCGHQPIELQCSRQHFNACRFSCETIRKSHRSICSHPRHSERPEIFTNLSGAQTISRLSRKLNDLQNKYQYIANKEFSNSSLSCLLCVGLYNSALQKELSLSSSFHVFRVGNQKTRTQTNKKKVHQTNDHRWWAGLHPRVVAFHQLGQTSQRWQAFRIVRLYSWCPGKWQDNCQLTFFCIVLWFCSASMAVL